MEGIVNGILEFEIFIVRFFEAKFFSFYIR